MIGILYRLNFRRKCLFRNFKKIITRGRNIFSDLKGGSWKISILEGGEKGEIKMPFSLPLESNGAT